MESPLLSALVFSFFSTAALLSTFLSLRGNGPGSSSERDRAKGRRSRSCRQLTQQHTKENEQSGAGQQEAARAAHAQPATRASRGSNRTRATHRSGTTSLSQSTAPALPHSAYTKSSPTNTRFLPESEKRPKEGTMSMRRCVPWSSARESSAAFQ